jgi:HSP20 family protein
MPWRSGETSVSTRGRNRDPVGALQVGINRAFDDFWRMLDFPPVASLGELAAADMRVDVSDTGREVKATAELPGMHGDDIDVTFTDGALTIHGEKKTESEKEEGGYLLRERSFGRFQRRVPLPDGVDVDAAEASFKDGVLTVTIPKTAEAQKGVKHIPVQAH